MRREVMVRLLRMEEFLPTASTCPENDILQMPLHVVKTARAGYSGSVSFEVGRCFLTSGLSNSRNCGYFFSRSEARLSDTLDAKSLYSWS